MKKFYLLTLSALTAVAVNAQKNDVIVAKQKAFKVDKQPVHKPVPNEKAVLWESDFSDASQWVTTHDAADCSLDFTSMFRNEFYNDNQRARSHKMAIIVRNFEPE